MSCHLAHLFSHCVKAVLARHLTPGHALIGHVISLVVISSLVMSCLLISTPVCHGTLHRVRFPGSRHAMHVMSRAYHSNTMRQTVTTTPRATAGLLCVRLLPTPLALPATKVAPATRNDVCVHHLLRLPRDTSRASPGDQSRCLPCITNLGGCY